MEKSAKALKQSISDVNKLPIIWTIGTSLTTARLQLAPGILTPIPSPVWNMALPIKPTDKVKFLPCLGKSVALQGTTLRKLMDTVNRSLLRKIPVKEDPILRTLIFSIPDASVRAKLLSSWQSGEMRYLDLIVKRTWASSLKRTPKGMWTFETKL
jgi:hypothetical protein